MQSLDITCIAEALEQCWSLASSLKWQESNPALGQCAVSALVVHDYLGGEIVKTKVLEQGAEAWHFYNIVENKMVDFTASQFAVPVVYNTVLSDRAEAFLDTNASEYEALSMAVKQHLRTTLKPAVPT